MTVPELKAWFWVVLGRTETASQVVMTFSDDLEKKFGSAKCRFEPGAENEEIEYTITARNQKSSPEISRSKLNRDVGKVVWEGYHGECEMLECCSLRL